MQSKSGPGANKRHSLIKAVVAESLESRRMLSAQLVKDINTQRVNAEFSPSGLTSAGSVAYFADSDGINGDELWKTDGTAAGTSMVKDLVLHCS